MKRGTASLVIVICLLMILPGLSRGELGLWAKEENWIDHNHNGAMDPYEDPSLAIDARVEDLLARMTVDEKIGQMTQAERGNLRAGEVKDYFLGSILSGGGSVPTPNTPAGWADMYDNFQREALATRLGIPIIYGADAVHGHNNVYGATIFPHNIGLGATRDPDLVEEIGRITAKEVAATGVDWTFGPCVAVSRDERWGRSYESFGEDPELQQLLAGSYVRGFQGTTMSGDRIVACAKHWVGDGGTLWGTGMYGKIDRGNTQCFESTLRTIHFPGYEEAIENGVGTIMVSYSSWNGVKMHENEYLITQVLKNELGFDGFIISDWNAIDELPYNSYHDKVVASVNAGIDMFMVPDRWKDFISELRSAVSSGEVSMTRIDDTVRRILRVKYKADLFEYPYADRSQQDGSFGSAAHRSLAREAVRKSLVLLKNKNNILPLSKSADIFVAGKNADNLGYQCGGWTISWQGGSGDITEGTTILEGIKQVATGSVTYNERGLGASGHDIAVVVIGETPYAEYEGDTNDLTLSLEDINCLDRVYGARIPVVVIMVSGRPLIVTNEIENWDAFVAAWLPGTEGKGVAEVLFGDYNFTGRLPVSWPREGSQIPINKGDSPYDPLFEYGYGLS